MACAIEWLRKQIFIPEFSRARSSDWIVAALNNTKNQEQQDGHSQRTHPEEVKES